MGDVDLEHPQDRTLLYQLGPLELARLVEPIGEIEPSPLLYQFLGWLFGFLHGSHSTALSLTEHELHVEVHVVQHPNLRANFKTPQSIRVSDIIIHTIEYPNRVACAVCALCAVRVHEWRACRQHYYGGLSLMRLSRGP
jgi:hypothetical protein